MPKAPRNLGGAGQQPQTVSRPQPGLRDPADPSNPWADDPAADGWPTTTTVIDRLNGKAEEPAEQAPPAEEPATPSEAAGEAPVAQERTPEEQAAIEAAHAMDDPSGGDMSGAELPPITPPTRALEDTPQLTTPPRATRRTPAKRAKPAPVQAEPVGAMAEPHDGGLQLANLDQTDEQVNLLVYGPEGVGKTTGVCTAANHGRVLVINAEGGLKVTPLRARGINTANIAVFPPPGKPEQLTVDNLERLFWQVKAELDADPAAWYAVIWDSVTEIGNKLLRDIVEREVARNSALPEGSAKRQAHRESADFTDRADYGVLSNQLLPILRKYRDLPCHFLVTALERRDVDEDSGRVMYGPATTPAVMSSLLGYVDVAIRVKNDAGENDDQPRFVGRTRPARNTRAKDRFGVTPPALTDPTFERVLGYLTGGLVAETPTDGAGEIAPAPAEKAAG